MSDSSARKAKVFVKSKGRQGMAEWAIQVVPVGKSPRRKSRKEFGLTQPQAYLKAVTEMLEEISEGAQLELVCNDNYLTDGINTYLAAWQANGWRKSDGGEIANKDAWQRLSAALTRHTVSARRSHTDDELRVLTEML
ncbi:MAG: RNase H family protein [Henriciella sp.]|uniref:RNase H family protein n=1 Tax=Henriciella sp. TaxID=1968823 RepID=UPI003C739CF0